LCDPQTSGGLLVSCTSAALPDVLDMFRREGFSASAPIGHMRAGAPVIRVEYVAGIAVNA
jgi:selenide,water dikinase